MFILNKSTISFVISGTGEGFFEAINLMFMAVSEGEL
jgi:hypothetical protein